MEKLEHIIRYSSERYFDTETNRAVVVGRHERLLVMIPDDVEGDTTTPVTVHAIDRQQIRFRLQTGRFTYLDIGKRVIFNWIQGFSRTA